MKFRSTLILLVLAGGLFAYIKFFDGKIKTTREAQKDAKQVVSLDRDKINSVTIKNAESEIELQKKENNVWVLEKPVKDRADSMVMNALFTTAELLRFDAVIGEDKPVEKEQLKEFGLASAETKVTFAGGEKPVEILFGKDAAVDGKIYVKLADEKKVYVIPNELKNQITKKADEFRDRKLLDLTTAQVNKVGLKTAAGEIELEKKNDHWSITKPLKARGDDAKVGDIIAQATTARIDSFVPDAANLASFGLQEPRGTVSLYAEGNDQPVVLQIGANPKDEKDKDKTYAKLSTRDAVVVLPKTVETLLDTKPNDLRDKNLLRVESDIVDRINIEGAGKDKIVLARNGESWVRKADGKDLAINAALATRLLNDFKAQQVLKFEADVASDLAKYGLDQPLVKVTFSSFASGNTAETKEGEKPIVSVLFGKDEKGNVFAKLDDEPFVVAVPTAILASVPADPLQWQDVAIYKMKPEEITSLEVTKDGQPTITLERDKDAWKLAKGDGNLNTIAVQSMVNTLASLRAVRWAGASTPDDGFDKPTVTVVFKTSTNTSGKLTIGAKTLDEMWKATAEGLTGTFILPRPNEEAFMLPLIERPAAAVPPAQPAAAPAGAPVAAPQIPAPEAPAPLPN